MKKEETIVFRSKNPQRVNKNNINEVIDNQMKEHTLGQQYQRTPHSQLQQTLTQHSLMQQHQQQLTLQQQQMDHTLTHQKKQQE